MCGRCAVHVLVRCVCVCSSSVSCQSRYARHYMHDFWYPYWIFLLNIQWNEIIVFERRNIAFSFLLPPVCFYFWFECFSEFFFFVFYSSHFREHSEFVDGSALLAQHSVCVFYIFRWYVWWLCADDRIHIAHIGEQSSFYLGLVGSVLPLGRSKDVQSMNR